MHHKNSKQIILTNYVAKLHYNTTQYTTQGQIVLNILEQLHALVLIRY